MVFDTNNPNNIEDHPEHDQDKIDPDLISEITIRINAGNLDPLGLLLIDGSLSLKGKI